MLFFFVINTWTSNRSSDMVNLDEENRSKTTQTEVRPQSKSRENGSKNQVLSPISLLVIDSEHHECFSREFIFKRYGDSGKRTCIVKNDEMKGNRFRSLYRYGYYLHPSHLYLQYLVVSYK